MELRNVKTEKKKGDNSTQFHLFYHVLILLLQAFFHNFCSQFWEKFVIMIINSVALKCLIYALKWLPSVLQTWHT